MRWFETPDFNFLKAYKVAPIVSGVLVVAAIIGLVTIGPQYGIDFSGGKEIVLEFEQPVEVAEVRSELTEPLDGEPEVKLFGSSQEILIRTDNPGEVSAVETAILETVEQLYPDNSATIIKTDIVGPRFAEDLKRGALNAVIFAIVVIFIYILVRFKDWAFSTGAVAALIHDVLIVLGIFVFFSEVAPFSMQIDQTIIAAFLTIVGYSINDTVVVFDRIRENSLLYKTMDYEKMINRSINDTLSRTVITSVTTFFVVAVLFLFGGEVLKGFSFALMLGVVIGTYSSIFVGAYTVVVLRRRRQNA